MTDLPKPCPYCARQQSGMYNMQCLGCRVRLVLSARPSRAKQEAMLAYIGQRGGATAERETRERLEAQSNSGI